MIAAAAAVVLRVVSQNIIKKNGNPGNALKQTSVCFTLLCYKLHDVKSL